MVISKNKKEILKYVLFGLLLISLFMICANPVLADVGNVNRYEDSGSLSDDYSGSSDDSGIIYLLLHIIIDLFRLIGPIPSLIVIGIFVLIVYRMKKVGMFKNIKNNMQQVKQSVQQKTYTTPVVNNTEQVSTEIREVDPAFSEEKFIGWAKEVFIKIQQAWTARDWKVIRPFESNELFSQHSAQLQEYINNNKINMIEKINIDYCELVSFSQDGDKEVLEVELHAVMRDYVIDATTREVLESDPNKDWHMRYMMTFNRKTGVKTSIGTSNKSTTNCPNCGAPTTITSSGQCEYCRSVITTGEHDWVLSDLRGIK